MSFFLFSQDECFVLVLFANLDQNWVILGYFGYHHSQQTAISQIYKPSWHLIGHELQLCFEEKKGSVTFSMVKKRHCHDISCCFITWFLNFCIPGYLYFAASSLKSDAMNASNYTSQVYLDPNGRAAYLADGVQDGLSTLCAPGWRCTWLMSTEVYQYTVCIQKLNRNRKGLLQRYH